MLETDAHRHGPESRHPLEKAIEQLGRDKHVQKMRHEFRVACLRIGLGDLSRVWLRDDNTFEVEGVELNEAEMDGLIARLSRLTVYEMAEDRSARSLLPARLNFLSTQHEFLLMMDKAYEAIDEWRASLGGGNVFVPEKHMRPARDVAKLKSVMPLVTPLLQTINRMMDLPLWDIFEKVRAAAYVTINRNNYREFMPQIEETYKEAWLDSSLLQELQNDPEGQRKFKERTRKGAFIFDYHEAQGNKPSVAEQMEQDFEAGERECVPRYEGRCLLDDAGKMMAWLTFWHTPRGGGKQHRDAVIDFLHDGASGAIEYYHDDDRIMLEQEADRVTRIDTIWRRKDAPLAARRLVAKSVVDILKENPEQQYLLGYHFWELHTHPLMRYLRQHPLQHADNESSYKFFRDRGCKSIALDSNEGGPVSRRQLPDGSRMDLRPAWMVFAGPMDEMRDRSIALWRKSQRQYGDITHDELPNPPYSLLTREQEDQSDT